MGAEGDWGTGGSREGSNPVKRVLKVNDCKCKLKQNPTIKRVEYNLLNE
jgi:hypothetical protein